MLNNFVVLVITLHLAEYLLVVIVAVVLTGSNVLGFTKCSKQASKQIREMASNAITSGLTVRFASHAGFEN